MLGVPEDCAGLRRDRAEFGDDMVACSVRRPSLPSASAQTASLQEENQSLRLELSKIHKTLELISKGAASGGRPELQALEAALAARQNELSEWFGSGCKSASASWRA